MAVGKSEPSPAWVLTATILGTSLVFIDGTVVSIGLPVIQSEFHAGAVEAQWVIEAYTLVLGALMLLSGALGDRYGRKRLFVFGAVLFALGSAACGLAPSMPVLIAARVLQGLGGTMLAPASLAILGACFTGPARGKAIGMWSGLSAVATAIGPVAGGAIVDHAGWRWIFFVNLPLAAATIAIALAHVPESRDEDARGPLDLLGALAITAGLGAIVYAFVASGSSGWNAGTIVCAIAGAAAIAGFLYIERVAPNPLMPLSLFSNRAFAGVNAMTFLLYGALGSLFYFLPFVMIQVEGYGGTVTGLAMLPFIVLMVALSRFSGMMVYRVGARSLLVAGPAIAAVGFALFGILPDLHYWSGIFPSVVAVGIGMGLTVAPLTTALLESIPEQHVGLASGINNAVSRVAALLAIAVLGAVLGSVFYARLDKRMNAASLSAPQRAAVEAQRDKMAAAVYRDPRETAVVHGAYVDAFRIVAFGCALLAAASSLTSAATLPSKRP